MVRPPRVGGPCVAGHPCSGRTSARARAPSTVGIGCRSIAAWCSLRVHRCGPPSRSALASSSCSARSLGSATLGRASVPSQRSRSFPPVDRTTVGLPSTRSLQTFDLRGDASLRIRSCRELLAPRTKADRSRGTIPRSPRPPARLVFRRAGTGGRRKQRCVTTPGSGIVVSSDVRRSTVMASGSALDSRGPTTV